MTADVIDIDELNTGKRREGIFGAIYWWMVKVGFAIAGALSGTIITFVGFNPDLATLDQQEAVDGLHASSVFSQWEEPSSQCLSCVIIASLKRRLKKQRLH